MRLSSRIGVDRAISPVASTLSILSGSLVLLTLVHVNGAPVSPKAPVRFGSVGNASFESVGNGTSPRFLFPYSPNTTHVSSQSIPLSYTLKAPNELSTKAVDLEKSSGVEEPGTALASLDATIGRSGPPLSPRGGHDPATPKVFYTAGRLIPKCHEPSDVLLVAHALEKGTVEANYKAYGIPQVSWDVWYEPYIKSLMEPGTVENPQLAFDIIKAKQFPCYSCSCTVDGKLSVGNARPPSDETMQMIPNFRENGCRRRYQAEFCEFVLGCYCYTLLKQPNRFAVKKGFRQLKSAFNRIPVVVRNHRDNIGFRWRVDPSIARARGQSFGFPNHPVTPDPEGLPPMNFGESIPAELAEVVSENPPVGSADVADLEGLPWSDLLGPGGEGFDIYGPPDLPPELFGPEEPPFDDNGGEGSSTGVRPPWYYDHYYGGPGGPGSGSGSPPPIKRDLPSQSDYPQNQNT
ncbi:hypothetical protein TWF481_004838 [Arthrobotrys musiformis]|uniref:Uncharacterized protein n=1 Tax=Arthrobotrys musiformis TaxID=47236 RepID=A0AAV9WKR7_9PEZI